MIYVILFNLLRMFAIHCFCSFRAIFLITCSTIVQVLSVLPGTSTLYAQLQFALCSRYLRLALVGLRGWVTFVQSLNSLHLFSHRHRRLERRYHPTSNIPLHRNSLIYSCRKSSIPGPRAGARGVLVGGHLYDRGGHVRCRKTKVVSRRQAF